MVGRVVLIAVSVPVVKFWSSLFETDYQVDKLLRILVMNKTVGIEICFFF